MSARQNPYVGPRAFQTGETLYGRERDLRQLEALLISERIALLHAPSGAGKTSLIQAGLIPSLAEQDFNALPVLRVNLEPPSDLPLDANFNRYVYSVLVSLEEPLKPRERLPLDELLEISLDEYLSRRPRAEEAPECDLLIFDQFEEILTAAPADRDGKLAFFAQLGAALRNRDRWALFSMREDYLGALSPYLRPIPGQLEQRYRLDLLSPEGARQAIQKPAQASGVDFTDEAARKLVDNLRIIQVQQPDGSTERQPGPSVEPVQLQVVCYRLWEATAGQETITEGDLGVIGTVDEALAGYYAATVAEVVEKTGVAEADVREWFHYKLITKEGLRGQVLRSREVSEGLDNHAIALLENAHLIRAEQRAGSTWYELAHDRLVEPVRTDNDLWFEKNLGVLQKQARLWDQHGRGEGLLLRGKAFDMAEQESQSLRLAEDEKFFLAACRALRQREQREQHRNALITILAIAATIALVVAGIFYFRAQNSANDAKVAAEKNAQLAQENANVAAAAQAASTEAVNQKNAAQAAESSAIQQSKINLSASLAAYASPLMDKNPSLAALLSLESLKIADQTNSYQPMAEQNLRDLLDNNFGYVLSGHANPISHILFTPDEGLLITADINMDSIRTWNLKVTDPSSASIKLPLGPFRNKLLSAMAISPDSRLLAVGSSTGTIHGLVGVVYMWQISDNAISQPPVEIIVDLDGGTVTALAFGERDNTYWLAAGMSNGKVALVDVSSSVKEFKAFQFAHGITRLNALVFSPDGHSLAAGSEEKQVRIRDVDNPDKGSVLHSQSGAVRSLAYSPDGNYLVGGGDAKELYVYNVKIPENKPFMLAKDLSNVKAIAFNPADPRLVAVGYSNGTIRIWDITSDSNNPISEIQSRTEINYLAFSPDGMWMVSTGMDMSVRLWDMINYKNGSKVRSKMLKGISGDIETMAFSSSSRWLVVGTANHEVHLWDFHRGFGSLDPISFGRGDDVYRSALFSPDGKWMVVRKQEGDNSFALFLWKTDEFIGGNRQPQLQLNKIAPMGFGSSAFSPDSKTLAIGFPEGDVTQVRLYNLDDSQAAPRTLPTDAGDFTFIGFSPSSAHQLVACDTQGNIRIWDTSNLEVEPVRQKFSMADLDWRQMSFSFSPQGRWLAGVAQYGTTDASIILLDLTRPQSAPLTYPGEEGGANTYAFSTDDRWLAVGNAASNSTVNGQAYLWDLSNLNPVPQLLDGHNGYVNTLAFNPFSNLLATGDDSGVIRLWDVLQPTHLISTIQFTKERIDVVRFSNDGRWLTAGSGDGTAGLWEVKFFMTNPSEGFYPLKGHQGPILNLDFSPDNQWLATGSADATIRLWNLWHPRSTPIILRSFNGESTYLKFESQGRFLVSNTDLAESQIWYLALDDLRNLACQVANRNLTESEWQQYLPEGLQRTATCPQWPLEAEPTATPTP